MASPVLFNRLALIGVGLIGGSIARAARALGIVREIVATSRSEPTRQRIARTGACRPGGRDQRRRGRRRRSGDRLRSDRRLRRSRKRNRPAPQARRDRLRRRLGQGRGGARHGAPHSGRRAFHSRPSGRRHRRIPAPMPASPSCSSTAGASSRRRRTPRRPPSSGCVQFWKAFGASVEIMSAGASRPGARGDQPCAAPDRLQHRRHGVRPAPTSPSRKSSNIPPAAFAISPASPRPTRPCGATFSCTTRKRCWKCSAASTRISRP